MSDYEEAKRLFSIGLQYHNNGNLEQAIIHYKKSIELYPDSTTMMNLANALVYKNQIYNAIDVYLLAIEVNPNNHLIYYNLGTAYEKVKLYKEAIESYKKAAKFDSVPLNFLSGTYYNMAICYHDGFNDLDNAMKCLIAANSLAPLDRQVEVTIRMYTREIEEKKQK